MVEKYQALTAGLTIDELMEFSRRFKAELYTEGLVQGNLSSRVSGRWSRHRLISCYVQATLFSFADFCASLSYL